MGMILKSNVIESSNPRMSRFNLTDVRVEAAEIIQRACDQLDAAKKQAEEIVEHSRTRAEETRQQAQAEGFQAGHAQGVQEGKKEGRQQALEEARKEFAEQNRQLRANLEQVFGQFEAERNHLVAQAHQDLLALALAIARKVTYRHLAIDPGLVIDTVKTAVNLVASRSLVEVKMNPEDIERFQLLDGDNAAKFFNFEQIKVIPDGNVETGGCVITTNNGKIDAQVSTQLQNLTHQLAPVMEAQVKVWAENDGGES